MTGQTCGCGRPTGGTILCRRCTHTLAWAIANIAGYTADLDTLRTRQARYTDPAPIRRGGGPLPLVVDHRFTDITPDLDDRTVGVGSLLETDAHDTIGTWTSTAHAALGGSRPPADVAGGCRWLMTRLPDLAGWVEAATLLDELCDLERRLRRFVDRPGGRWYAGPCTAGLSSMAGTWICGAELYAGTGARSVTCRDCGTSYTVEQRRAWLLAAAHDRWETASVIARTVVVLGEYQPGEKRLVNRIGQWTKTRRLPVRDHTWWGQRKLSLYRIGDVLDLIDEDARRSRNRSA